MNARELRVGRFRLSVVAGPDSGKCHESDADELVVGTAPGNQLVLGDPTVSRHHLSIAATQNGFLLRDLGSTNGTSVGGLRVEAAYLAPGALVFAGETQLRFELLDDEVKEPLAKEDRWGRVLGASPAMRRIFAMLPKLAGSTSTVLITGETGTGKGLLAESIHRQGPRAQQPFVVIDCGAIPPTLIEAELFGHERGAFTGAHGARAGAFELAQAGTVFLDEIGELPLDMQPKLLRALEERTVKRLGGTERIPLDVRVIAATSRELHQEVNRGSFRSDLFYRLNVVRLRIPPLRERSEDIALLAAHFYQQLGDGSDPPAELLTQLSRQPWPGNVRELRGAIERALLFGNETLDEPSAPPRNDAGEELSFRVAKERAVARWEKSWVEALLERHQRNLSAAARAARMDRNHLREILRKHKLRLDE